MAGELVGLEELSKQLAKLGAAVGSKTLRQALMSATLPAYKAAKMAAPVGENSHRTYKGNLVGPGFLSRSVARKSYFNKRTGVASVMIGVKPEAFYGVQFVELGTKYQPAQPWLGPAFKKSRNAMEARFKHMLKRKIEKIANK